MAIPDLNLDDRRYQDLLDEARARIPVHTPEWTNFQPSDPGITIVELFAFLAETLLYRCNLVPERNRRAFLNLLGIPLRPASSARGLVAFRNERGPSRVITLGRDVEVGAGAIPFRTTRGLDILPVEARAYFKRELRAPSEAMVGAYNQLYATFRTASPPPSLRLYEAVPVDERLPAGVSLGEDTIDGAVWIALLARPSDADLDLVRRQIAGATLSLGVVPVSEDSGLRLPPGSPSSRAGGSTLSISLPSPPAGGALPPQDNARFASYATLATRAEVDVLEAPGVVEIDLPRDPEALRLWSNLDPLEAGARNFPPTLEDSALDARLITWLRLGAPSGRVRWLGINAVPVIQRKRTAGERLPDGTGEPDQSATLSNRPVLPGSVTLSVEVQGRVGAWTEIDDLAAAGPEAIHPDPLLPPGRAARPAPPSEVFALDAVSGVIRFGDGFWGRRPPPGATIRADYDTGVGRAGNVAAGAISGGPSLPAGVTVSNPVRTWGGADPESVRDGEAQIARHLRHQDRMVTAGDFATIALRTPGVELGRVVVLPAYHPDLAPSEPGDAPGAVTVMVIPRTDPGQPDAPMPDRVVLDAVCRHLDPRRLVTTEVFLRPPRYRPIWISIGLEARAGASFPPVREAVRRALIAYLSPLPTDPDAALDLRATVFDGVDRSDPSSSGWPLRKAVDALELATVAGRVPEVLLVRQVLLAESDGPAAASIPMVGLELPRVAGISVASGDAIELDALRGQSPTAIGGAGQFVPVPIVPEECR